MSHSASFRSTPRFDAAARVRRWKAAARHVVWLVWMAVAAFGFSAAEARAEERIWSAIVLASDVEKPREAPEELEKLAPRIERFFGYNQLELIGSATKGIDDECERWLVPSQHFWLCVKAKKSAEERMYNLKVSLFHDKRQIVETDAKLAGDMPLLIRGPMHARGQLLIVVQMQR